MHFTNPPLQEIRIAAPCKAEWKWMYGNERVRFCGQCNLNVYNLTAMTAEQAEDIIRRAEGQLCVRFYRRRDGTILVKNCPVGIRSLKEKLTSTRTAVISALLSFLAYLGILWWFNRTPSPFMGIIGEPASVVESPLIEKSEQFIRENSLFKTAPFFYLVGPNQAKGDAVVRVLIAPSGEVINATFIEGNPALKKAAEAAARDWKFKPMLEGGRPARVESRLTFQFGNSAKPQDNNARAQRDQTR